MIQVTRIFNSPFLGVYLRTWEDYTLVPRNSDRDIKSMASHYLKTEPIEMTIGGSNLLGSMAVMNSNGMIFSNIVTEEELKNIPKDVNYAVLEDNLNAVGNNILANNKAALIHEEFSDESVRTIREVLGVEVVKGKFKEVRTVGSSGLITSSGLVIPPNMYFSIAGTFSFSATEAFFAAELSSLVPEEDTDLPFLLFSTYPSFSRSCSADLSTFLDPFPAWCALDPLSTFPPY